MVKLEGEVGIIQAEEGITVEEYESISSGETKSER